MEYLMSTSGIKEDEGHVPIQLFARLCNGHCNPLCALRFRCMDEQLTSCIFSSCEHHRGTPVQVGVGWVGSLIDADHVRQSSLATPTGNSVGCCKNLTIATLTRVSTHTQSLACIRTQESTAVLASFAVCQLLQPGARQGD
eukprot:4923927-Amphidinium_carterae.2